MSKLAIVVNKPCKNEVRARPNKNVLITEKFSQAVADH